MKFNMFTLLSAFMAGTSLLTAPVAAGNFMQGYLASDATCTESDITLIKYMMYQAEVCAGRLMEIQFPDAEQTLQTAPEEEKQEVAIISGDDTLLRTTDTTTTDTKTLDTTTTDTKTTTLSRDVFYGVRRRLTQEEKEEQDRIRRLDEVERELFNICSCCGQPMCCGIPYDCNCRRLEEVPPSEEETRKLEEVKQELVKERETLVLSTQYQVEQSAVQNWMTCFERYLPKLKYYVTADCGAGLDRAVMDMSAFIEI